MGTIDAPKPPASRLLGAWSGGWDSLYISLVPLPATFLDSIHRVRLHPAVQDLLDPCRRQHAGLDDD
jgi:hypothetical protein